MLNRGEPANTAYALQNITLYNISTTTAQRRTDVVQLLCLCLLGDYVENDIVIAMAILPYQLHFK